MFDLVATRLICSVVWKEYLKHTSIYTSLAYQLSQLIGIGSTNFLPKAHNSNYQGTSRHVQGQHRNPVKHQETDSLPKQKLLWNVQTRRFPLPPDWDFEVKQVGTCPWKSTPEPKTDRENFIGHHSKNSLTLVHFHEI